MPFGLNLKIGDIVSVNQDGSFTLEGSCHSLLGRDAGAVRPPDAAVNLIRQSGKNTAIHFRAQGQTSTLFQNLPNGNAGIDISFGSADSWVLGLTGRAISSIEEVDSLRNSILDAHSRKVWKADWVLINSLATVEKMTLIASTIQNTNVALSLTGQADTTTPLELQLTAGATIVATNNELIQSITTAPAAAFCSGIRVKSSWFGGSSTAMLGLAEARTNPLTAPHAEFWEDMDEV
jgi:hypothetical protein